MAETAAPERAHPPGTEALWLLRIGTKLDDVDDFVLHFARLVDGQRMMLATRERHADGSVVAFEVLLRDRSVVFAGTGRVLASFPARPGRPFGGIRLEVLTLDEASKEMHARLLVARMPVEPEGERDTVPLTPEMLAGAAGSGPAATPTSPSPQTTQPMTAGELGDITRQARTTKPPVLRRGAAVVRKTQPISADMLISLRSLSSPTLLPPFERLADGSGDLAAVTGEPRTTAAMPEAVVRPAPVGRPPALAPVDNRDLEGFVDAHVEPRDTAQIKYADAQAAPLSPAGGGSGTDRVGAAAWLASPRARTAVIAAATAVLVMGLVVAYRMGARSSAEAAEPASARVIAATPAVAKVVVPEAPDAAGAAARAAPAEARPTAPPAAQGCKLAVKSVPEGAAVSIAGQPAGVTPLAAAPAPCGDVVVRVERERYEPVEKEVRLSEASPGVVDARLARPRATLELTSTPVGAVFSVNGQKVTGSPPRITLDAYTHATVTASMLGYKVWQEKVYVKGKTMKVVAPLEKLAPAKKPK